MGGKIIEKRIFIILLVALLVFSSVVPISIGQDIKTPNDVQSSNRSNTLYVGGSPGCYTKIQDAINDAMDGDMVFVYDDLSPYYENIIINKSIILKGQNKDTTIIDGQYLNNIVTVKSSNATLTGFSLINCRKNLDWEYNCIMIEGCDNVTIEDNIITHNNDNWNDWNACVFLSGSSYNNIKGNILYDDGPSLGKVGVQIYDNSYYNNISGNEIYGLQIGIYIMAYSSIKSCSNNMIYDNFFHDCWVGISSFAESNYIIKNNIINCGHNGADIGAGYNVISGNIISGNGGGGDLNGGLWTYGDYFQITDNYFLNNDGDGIEINGDYYTISNNHFSGNTRYGLLLDYSYYNDIVGNNFIDNNVNGFFNGVFSVCNTNNWNKNYWSDSLGLLPKIITGRVAFLFFIEFDWFNIDWRPAKRPYDI